MMSSKKKLSEVKAEAPVLPAKITMQALAFRIVTNYKLNRKSIFKDIWTAIKKEVTDDVIPTIEGGWTIQSFNRLIQLILFYISRQ